MEQITTSLQGTWAYAAESLIERGQLKVGRHISLRREPENKFDTNAISAHISDDKIGYLPRELASRLSGYMDRQGSWAASVTHIGKRTQKGKTFPTVSISLKLADIEPPAEISELYEACRALNRICGIYLFQNNITGQAYIGSSSDIGDRIRRHIAQLRSGTHANHELSKSWVEYGPKAFRIQLLEEVDDSNLLSREAYYIRRHGTHASGFNRTRDGRGTKPRRTLREPLQESSHNEKPHNPPPRDQRESPTYGCFTILVAATPLASFLYLLGILL